MNRLDVSRTSSPPKYAQVAARVRAQVADGLLLPGEAVPSGAALSRATGFSVLTCRRALRTLIEDGVLVPGASRSARPRVPPRTPASGERTQADTARALSASLAARRRLAGLTQPQLAALVGVSVTTVGHAETGRLWQSRRFWEGPTLYSARAGNSWPGTTLTAPQPSRPASPRPTPTRRTLLPTSCQRSRSPPPDPSHA